MFFRQYPVSFFWDIFEIERLSENMILINWNVEWASPKTRKTPEILDRIQQHNPELVCLTETHPNLLTSGHVIHSQPDYGYKTSRGYKVLLWSANPWSNIDNIGSNLLPPGRFVSGITQTSLGELLVVGACIPWRGSRTGRGASEKREAWQDHHDYLRVLSTLLAELVKTHKTLVLTGDFNQRINGSIHYAPVALRGLLRFALGSLTIPTSATDFNFNGRPSIDHVCLNGLKSRSIRPIDNYHAGKRLSDHFGIVADLYKSNRT